MHEMSKLVFWQKKNKKTTSIRLLLKILPRVLSVNAAAPADSG